jgi:hypothetical protein
MTSVEQTSFYIARSGRTHGPLDWTEIERYFASGSLKPSDLVCAANTEQWQPLSEWQRLASGDMPEAMEEVAYADQGWLKRFTTKLFRRHSAETKCRQVLRRRIVRYREWDHVPREQRSTTNLRDLIVGFWFWPPRFIAACSRIFTQHIFRRAMDEAGYLKVWSPKVETFCAILIVLHCAWWFFLVYEFQHKIWPVLVLAAKTLFDSTYDFMHSR